MIYNLIEIARLTTGAYLKPSPSGDYNYLNAKHFDGFGSINEDYYSSTFKVELAGRNLEHSLRNEDLLLVAKGDKNKACYYQTDIGKAVASSTFIVLRCQRDIVKPKFLFWLLNTTMVQHRLSRLSKGTHVKSISIKVLSQLQLNIPRLDDQDHFIEMSSLISREREIQQELVELKNKYYDNLLIKKLQQNEV